MLVVPDKKSLTLLEFNPKLGFFKAVGGACILPVAPPASEDFILELPMPVVTGSFEVKLLLSPPNPNPPKSLSIFELRSKPCALLLPAGFFMVKSKALSKS